MTVIKLMASLIVMSFDFYNIVLLNTHFDHTSPLMVRFDMALCEHIKGVTRFISRTDRNFFVERW